MIAFIILLNICLQAVFYLQTKDKEYFYQILLWLLSLMYLGVNLLFNQGTMTMIMAFATIMPSMLTLALISSYYTKLKINWMGYILFYLVSIGLSFFLNSLNMNFIITSAPVALAVGLPTFNMGVRILKHQRHKGFLYVALAIFLILQSVHMFDYPFLRTDSKNLLWAFALIYTLFQALSLIFPAINITRKEEKITQDLRAQVKEQTKELQKALDLKDITYQVLVHDFANYVFALIANLRAMKRTDLTEGQLKIANTNSGILEKMKDLIREIRQLERILNTNSNEEMKFEYKNLHQLIYEVEKAYTPKLESKKLKIINDIPKELEVYVYEPFFSISIIGNYLSNAIKFSNPDSSIRVFAHINEMQNLSITIEDSGIGMSQDDLEKLNRATSPRRRTGTHKESGIGLGTLIATNYIRIHGFQVVFDSQEANPKENIPGRTTINIKLNREQYR